ncbi:hypothetical protein QFZ68_006504 [Streptomyces sp. V1I6]|nr:hypothetical protein [Streptomyces sp. V1I6]
MGGALLRAGSGTGRCPPAGRSGTGCAPRGAWPVRLRAALGGRGQAHGGVPRCPALPGCVSPLAGRGPVRCVLPLRGVAAPVVGAGGGASGGGCPEWLSSPRFARVATLYFRTPPSSDPAPLPPDRPVPARGRAGSCPRLARPSGRWSLHAGRRTGPAAAPARGGPRVGSLDQGRCSYRAEGGPSARAGARSGRQGPVAARSCRSGGVGASAPTEPLSPSGGGRLGRQPPRGPGLAPVSGRGGVGETPLGHRPVSASSPLRPCHCPYLPPKLADCDMT